MSFNSNAKSRVLACCIMFGLGVLILGFHHELLNGWWRGDDTQILKFVWQHKPWEYFFLPKVSQEFTASNLTPWVALSYDFDLALFGLNPAPYYIHHLIILWLVLALTFFLLRLWLNPLFAGLGAVLFACGAPFFFSSQILYTRHYWEGLIFAILALYLFVRAVRDHRPTFSWLGAAFFLLAVSAKELYVPLVVALPFLLEKDITHRLRAAIPFILVAFLYVGWRWYMLGHPIGGYSHIIAWGNFLSLPVNISAYIFGKGVAGLALLSGMILALILTSKDKWQASLFIIVVVIAVLGPLVPIADLVAHGGHYSIVLWWVVSFSIAVTLSKFGHSFAGLSIGFGVGVVILCSVLYQSWELRERSLPWIHEMEMQGKFVWNSEREALFSSPSLTRISWYLNGLQWLREQDNGGVLKPSVIVDELQLSQVNLDDMEVWSYSASCECVENISLKVPGMLQQWEGRKEIRSLSLRAEYENNIASMRFGPYEQGTYYVINTGGAKRIFPRSFRSRAHLSQLSFYVRYDSPEGWVTYSPLLHFNGEHESSFKWERVLPLQ